MKILVVDDEPLARQIIIEFLNRIDTSFSVDEAVNGKDAQKKCTTSDYDILFLDIEMPKMTGLEFLSNTIYDSKIIFTTAYNEYAVKAFELNVVDYILKPFTFSRFKIAFEKAINSKKTLIDIYHSLNNISNRTNRILIKENKKLVFIKHEDIVYIKSCADYVEIHVKNGGCYFDDLSLNAYEEKLANEQFVRIHRSTLLNIDFIKEIEIVGHQKMEVLLTNNVILPVSKSGQKLLKELG